MPHELLGESLAIAAAVSWGGADFCGGVSAGTSHPATVVMLSQAAGCLCMLIFALASGEALPSSTALLFGAAAGVGAGIGNLCFYRALAIGHMGINAPLAAIVTSGLSVLYSVFLFDHQIPTALQGLGFAVAGAAIWLMTLSRGPSRGLALAVLGGLGFSAYLTFSKQATADAVFWPLVAARLAAVGVLLPALRSPRARHPPARWSYVLAAGVLDALANALFVGSTRHARLDVATILSAFYPAITVLCARLFLHERVTRLQLAGIAAALVAIPLIASH